MQIKYIPAVMETTVHVVMLLDVDSVFTTHVGNIHVLLLGAVAESTFN